VVLALTDHSRPAKRRALTRSSSPNGAASPLWIEHRSEHPPIPQPTSGRVIAWRAQHRLHRVHHRMHDRGKPHNVTTIAVARELAGFLSAAATAP
jgi:hypothetical protein